MWIVLAQLEVLGRSSVSQFYGLYDMTEAQAYWAHPVLGPRLEETLLTLLGIESKSANETFGSPDYLKLCSCLTLFERVSSQACFASALVHFYGGQRDEATLSSLLEPHEQREEPPTICNGA